MRDNLVNRLNKSEATSAQSQSSKCTSLRDKGRPCLLPDRQRCSLKCSSRWVLSSAAASGSTELAHCLHSKSQRWTCIFPLASKLQSGCTQSKVAVHKVAVHKEAVPKVAVPIVAVPRAKWLYPEQSAGTHKTARCALMASCTREGNCPVAYEVNGGRQVMDLTKGRSC